MAYCKLGVDYHDAVVVHTNRPQEDGKSKKTTSNMWDRSKCMMPGPR